MVGVCSAQIQAQNEHTRHRRREQEGLSDPLSRFPVLRGSDLRVYWKYTDQVYRNERE